MDVCPSHCIAMVPARQIDWGRLYFGDGGFGDGGWNGGGDSPLEASRGEGYVLMMYETSCICCRLCVQRCPTDAINVRRFKANRDMANGERVHEYGDVG